MDFRLVFGEQFLFVAFRHRSAVFTPMREGRHHTTAGPATRFLPHRQPWGVAEARETVHLKAGDQQVRRIGFRAEPGLNTVERLIQAGPPSCHSALPIDPLQADVQQLHHDFCGVSGGVQKQIHSRSNGVRYFKFFRVIWRERSSFAFPNSSRFPRSHCSKFCSNF